VTWTVEAWSSLIAVYDLDAGRVAAEDHRLLFLADADSLQGSQSVVVERGGLDGDGGPAGGHAGSERSPNSSLLSS
jgi:hypothetical protein